MQKYFEVWHMYFSLLTKGWWQEVSLTWVQLDLSSLCHQSLLELFALNTNRLSNMSVPGENVNVIHWLFA